MGWLKNAKAKVEQTVERTREDWQAAGDALDRADARAKKQVKAKPAGECSQIKCTEPVWQAGVCKGCYSAIF